MGEMMINIDRFRFRIWDTKTKKMFTNDTIRNFSPVVDVEKIDFKRYIPMQCTGLKDKKGNLVYEGDIVDVFVDGMLESSHEVAWFGQDGYPAFDLVDSQVEHNFLSEVSNNIDLTTDISMVVIGNIYTNPELLGKHDK